MADTAVGVMHLIKTMEVEAAVAVVVVDTAVAAGTAVVVDMEAAVVVAMAVDTLEVVAATTRYTEKNR